MTGRTEGIVLRAATLGAAIALAAAGPALAGAESYDMTGLLNEPHPFADMPPPPPPALPAGNAATGQGYGTMPGPVAPPPVRTAAGASAPPDIAPAAGPTGVQIAQQADAGMWGAPPDGEDTAFVTFGLGGFDINDNETAAEFRVAWRGRRIAWLMKPLAGVMGTSDGAVFAYGGVLFDIYLGRNVVLTPSFAPGLYGHGGGKDLGSVIEFRSAVEIAWRFHDHSRLGLMFYHISNASIGDRNPGTEVLSLSYSLPLK